MIDISNHTFESNCPSCSGKFTATLGQVSRQETISCRSCKQAIKLVDQNGSASKGIKDINKSFDQLSRTIKNLGR